MARPVLRPEDLHRDTVELWAVMKETSPLAAALICSAFLDKALAALLMKFFVKSETAKGLLDDNNGSLGDFFSRANVAYCLGLIPIKVFQNLLSILEVRNTFAHSHRRIDFSDEKVAGLCKQLKMPTMVDMIAIGNKPGERGEPTMLKDVLDDHSVKFRLISLLTFNTIIHIALSTEHRNRPKNQPMWT
jgi:hypothetical protein